MLQIIPSLGEKLFPVRRVPPKERREISLTRIYRKSYQEDQRNLKIYNKMIRGGGGGGNIGKKCLNKKCPVSALKRLTGNIGLFKDGL